LSAKSQPYESQTASPARPHYENWFRAECFLQKRQMTTIKPITDGMRAVHPSIERCA
jgi:hypothetical protein